MRGSVRLVAAAATRLRTDRGGGPGAVGSDRPGGICVVAWSAGKGCGRWAAASAAIPWPTSDRLKNH